MKTLTVTLKSSSEVLSDFKAALNKTNYYKKNPKYEISFDSKRDFTKFVNNIDILSIISKFKPKSVYELSKLCDKDVSNINKIINFFNELGIIKIKRTRIEGREVNTPIVEYDNIRFNLAA